MGSLPETYKAWQLFGAGFESIGRDDAPVALPLREPLENEVLLRTDAIGLCLSDIKIIRLGNGHPRLAGRDLATEPTVLGHECSATVVRVGDRWRDRFHPGERYVVQADIYYHGEGYAFGYRIPGGLAEYFYLDERAIEGDEGCYLLPVDASLGFSQAALTEPWACVEMSYNLDDEFQFADTCGAGVEPDIRGGVCDRIANSSRRLFEKFEKNTGAFICGLPPRESLTMWVDIGRIHYDGIRVLGGGKTNDEIMEANKRHDLLAGGAALFVGGGGPMGQMHVQRAIEHTNGPKRVVVSDLDEGRLNHIRERFGSLAESRGIELITVTTSKDSGRAIFEPYAPDGYDDIVIMVPDASLVSELMPIAADRAVVNVFAGVPVGSYTQVRLYDICRAVKITGSSGSRIRDMKTVLEKVERGELNTNLSVAAIGGLNAGKRGLEGLRDARYPGKTVIYPQLPDLPLMSIGEAAEQIDALKGALSPEGAWTVEAEKALLEAASCNV